MKKRKHIVSMIAMVFAIMAIPFMGCTDELFSPNNQVLRPSEVLTFKTTLSNGIDVGVSRSTSGHLLIEEEEWTLEGTDSRASMMTYLNGEAQVLGFLNGTEKINSTLTFRGDELTNTTNPVFWKSVDKADDGTDVAEDLHIYAYAPKVIEGRTFNYTVPSTAKDQKDIVVDDVIVEMKEDKTHRKEIPLTFKHIFTAVRFKLGFDCTVKSITLEGIKKVGSYTIGTGWTIADDAQKDSYTFNYNDGKSFLKDDIVSDTLMLLPQTLAEGAEVTMEYVKDGTPNSLVATLDGKTWGEGKFITYTLREKEQGIVYLDLAAGDVTIDGNKYTGSYYTDETNRVFVDKKEFNPNTVKFYIYQSTAAKRKEGQGIIKDGSWQELTYDPVKVGNLLWSEFITNNTDVEAVIEAWDNVEGAGQAGATTEFEKEPNQEGALGAVRDANREATKYRIHIVGNVGNINLTIDNIYSSYQQRAGVWDDGAVRGRDKGGISFLPSQANGSNSTLTVNIVGDNRLGCVNYQNNVSDRNGLVFEGTGSLTVADTDYYYKIETLGSNRSCSVIGGKDEPREQQDVYNITFNSGVIYAGATTSACTAIGGGGNGNTNIVINGGTITAVAKTTGTAIGGGTGLKQKGGQGDVTINNGTIYAYNYRNTSNVPSSAIGGAGTRDLEGGNGTVNIYGGYVYAFSQYGTAVGGGSSAKKSGGSAVINIYGGMIIAQSGDGAGIGGGSACTWGSGSNMNGGNAELIISGNPVIRTGSIGGGSTGAKNSYIGLAVIDIFGNPDIQAQFVMAAGAKKTPSFTMYGGVIRNTDVTQTFDNPNSTAEYKYIQPNGGAVYLEDGNFTMYGGTIEHCEATNGGAVYIKGSDNTTFTMSGGEIIGCTSAGNGGAVYLEGGQVILNSDTKKTSIRRNIAYNGNGGGIYVDKGSFEMSGDVWIEGNAAMSRTATDKGRGGGLYVTSSTENVTVDIGSGYIQGNSSDRLGGGVCVEMTGGTEASITVGTEEGTDKENPSITGNHTLKEGGGLYANGINANVTIHHGTINGNTTTAYVHNENVANEGGMVTLVGSDDKVDVTYNVVYFHANAADATFSNDGLVQTAEQRIVRSTNSLLVQPDVVKRNDYTLKCWHTRADGNDNKGKSYKNGAKMNINQDLHLYAQWE